MLEQETGLQDDTRVLPQVVVKGGTIHQIQDNTEQGGLSVGPPGGTFQQDLESID